MLEEFFRFRLPSVEIPRSRVTREGAEELSGVDEFRLAIVRHCARARRSGRLFSLILFDLSSVPPNRRDKVADTATDRARATDQVGWYALNEKLGVILCGCQAEPARTFADAVVNDNASEAATLVYQLYTYPGDLLPAEIANLLPETKRHAGSRTSETAD